MFFKAKRIVDSKSKTNKKKYLKWLFMIILITMLIMLIVLLIQKDRPLKSFKVIWDYVDGTAVALTDKSELVLIDINKQVLCTLVDNQKGDRDWAFNWLYGIGTAANNLLSYDGEAFRIIDRRGNTCSKEYQFAFMSDDGAAFYVSDDLKEYYFIDEHGNDLNRGIRWDEIDGFFDFDYNGQQYCDCCIVNDNGLFGITDGRGNYIIHPEYSSITQDFTGGIIAITIDGDIRVLQNSGC